MIVGGVEAADKEFPHMALIGYNKSEDEFSFVCGGSLISSRFILSAAHCSFHPDFGAATLAKIGDVRRGNNTENTLLVHIMERIKHPGYKRDSIDHDIMLFKLHESVQFNDYIRPICLPHINEKVKRAVVTGYGSTGFGQDLSINLLKVTLDIFNQTDCQSKYSQTGLIKNGIDEETKMCAGSYFKNKDSCGGDSGISNLIVNLIYRW